MILGVVYRSPAIYLTAEENPGKPQEERLMNDQPSPQMGFLTSKLRRLDRTALHRGIGGK